MNRADVRYYALIKSGDTYALILVVRDNGRTVSNEPTGKTWPATSRGWRHASRHVCSLNQAIAGPDPTGRPLL